MYYVSTRNSSLRKTASQAIEQGLSDDGGLFLPQTLPQLPELSTLLPMSYAQRAAALMELFLDDFTREELEQYAAMAYGAEKFDCPQVAPVRDLSCKTSVLELWHGPTCAFKDMALQMLPYLLTAAMKKNGEDKTVCILVATSGDTGKAALEGFRDVDGTKILVFYPKDGVSQMQKLQMVTQEGNNVGVAAVRGNFDNAQSGVKEIFASASLKQEFAEQGYVLSSANSINWGRVLPQIVYYVSAYCDLITQGKIRQGDRINVSIPTGNFGNILACYYAKKMGLPVGKLICASNANHVLTDFLKTGRYDRNRPFYTTISPSMDILISSNLERLLYDLTGSDEEVAGYMDELARTGAYQVSEKVMEKIRAQFVSGFSDDRRTRNAMEKIFHETGYLMDPHTAVAYTVLQDYRASTADDTPALVVSTASPFKFCDSVLDALGIVQHRPGTKVLAQLSEITGHSVPKPLSALAGKSVRFHHATEKTAMEQEVREFLHGWHFIL